MTHDRYDSRWGVVGKGDRSPDIDEDLRLYMLQVYNYMGGGLLVTAVIAYLAAVSGLYLELYKTGLFWVILLAPVILVFVLSIRLHRISVRTAQIMFWLCAGLIGLSLAGIFVIYTSLSIAQTFGVSAAMYLDTSLYGYTTGRDLSGIGTFLLMALFGLIIAGLVNLFLASATVQFVLSAIGVVIFTGLTAWDTQRIRKAFFDHEGQADRRKIAVIGALTLYLDFLNLFLMLLRFFGRRRD